MQIEGLNDWTEMNQLEIHFLLYLLRMSSLTILRLTQQT